MQLVILNVTVGGGDCVSWCVCVQRSEENLQELVFSLYHVALWHGTVESLDLCLSAGARAVQMRE